MSSEDAIIAIIEALAAKTREQKEQQQRASAPSGQSMQRVPAASVAPPPMPDIPLAAASSPIPAPVVEVDAYAHEQHSAAGDVLGIHESLRDPVALRRALVMREILGPPRALHDPWSR